MHIIVGLNAHNIIKYRKINIKNLDDSKQNSNIPFGKIYGNKNIPITNSFNRSPIFTTWCNNQKNTVITSDSPIEYDSDSYSISMIGSRLNQDTDYPILSLIIKNWMNARLDRSGEQNIIKVSLLDILELLGKSYKDSRAKNVGLINNSLNRLCTAAILLTIKKKKKPFLITERSALLASSKLFYGEKANGYIEVEIGKLLKELYEPEQNQKFPSFTYMDLEGLQKAGSSNAAIIMRYLMTQRADYIEFSLSSLLSLIEFDFTKSDLNKIKYGRSKVSKALQELIDIEFVTDYRTNTDRGWTTVTIITSKVTTDKKKAELLLNGSSNYNYFKKKTKGEVEPPKPSRK